MMRSRGGKWTADEDETLKRLYAVSPPYSASQIAAEMASGLTRNAVIGRIHRLGLPLRGRPKGASHPRMNIQRVRAARKKTEVIRIVRANKNGDLRLFVSSTIEPAELRCVEVLPRNISLSDLEPGDCRYPYGDSPFTFCGHRSAEGRSYCIPHLFLCDKPAHGGQGREEPPQSIAAMRRACLPKSIALNVPSEGLWERS